MCSGEARWKPSAITTAVGLFLGWSIAMAQQAQQAGYIIPPMHSPLDKNGVNLATQTFQRTSALLSLGNPEFSGIAVTENWYGAGAGSGSTKSYMNFLEAIIYNGAYFLGWNAVYNGRRYYFSPTGQSADLCGHLRQSSLCEAIHDQDADRGG